MIMSHLSTLVPVAPHPHPLPTRGRGRTRFPNAAPLITARLPPPTVGEGRGGGACSTIANRGAAT